MNRTNLFKNSICVTFYFLFLFILHFYKNKSKKLSKYILLRQIFLKCYK